MTAAVLFLWSGCLWAIARSVLSLLLTAPPWRKLLVLAVLTLALSSCHKPRERTRPPA